MIEQGMDRPDVLLESPVMPIGIPSRSSSGFWSYLRGLGRAISSFPALIVGILIAKVYWTCRDNIADPDLWWHLRNAQHFIATWRFPNVDTYSFTAAGAPWVNHEWLSELFYYGAFSAFGLRGVYLVFASVLAVLVVAVF